MKLFRPMNYNEDKDSFFVYVVPKTTRDRRPNGFVYFCEHQLQVRTLLVK